MADNMEKEKKSQNRTCSGSGQVFMEGQFKNLRLTSIFLFPLVAFLAFRAQDIIPFFFGKESVAVVFPFQIIIWTAIFIYYTYILLRTALVLNRKRIVYLSLGLEAISAIMLNFSLIPAYGLEGLSIATLATGFIMFVFTVFCLTIEGIKFPFYKSWEKPAIATMGLTVILHYGEAQPAFVRSGLAGWSFPLIFLAGFTGYSSILIILFALDR